MTREEWLSDFGDNLQGLLDEKDLKQRDLAKMTKIPISTINAYINKKAMPSAEAIVKLSYALDVELIDLLDFGETID